MVTWGSTSPSPCADGAEGSLLPREELRRCGVHLLTASVGVVRGVGSNSQQQPFDLCGQLTMDVGQNVLWLPVWKRGRHLEPPTLLDGGTVGSAGSTAARTSGLVRD